MRASAMKAVAIAIEPCAKLTIRVDRQIRTSARAKAAKTMPCARPERVVSTNCCTGGAFLVLRKGVGATDLGSEAQVGVPEVLVGHERRGVVGGDDAAQVEDDPDVGDRQRAAGVLLDQQHRQALGV